MHAESAVRALHEQQRQHREDVVHAAMIRAGLCAARGLSESQACHPPGCPSLLPSGHAAGFAQAPDCAPALGAFLPESPDTEGGEA